MICHFGGWAEVALEFWWSERNSRWSLAVRPGPNGGPRAWPHGAGPIAQVGDEDMALTRSAHRSDTISAEFRVCGSVTDTQVGVKNQLIFPPAPQTPQTQTLLSTWLIPCGCSSSPREAGRAA